MRGYRYVEILLVSLITWLIALYAFGFTHGTGDQTEIIPYIDYLRSSGLFAGDFYIQSSESLEPNVRTVFVQAFMPLGTSVGLWLILHGLFTVLISAGLILICAELIGSLRLSYIVPPVAMVLLYSTLPGGNDIYNPAVVAETVALCFAVWSLLLYLKGFWYETMAFLILATWFQPLVGLQVFVLLLFTDMLRGGFRWQRIIPVTAYLILGGGYVLLLQRAKGPYPAVSGAEFENIVFYFRNPHHFVPSVFNFKKVMFALGLWGSGVVYFWNNRTIRAILLVIFLGSITYFVSFEFDILKGVFGRSQWFKTMVWVKVFGVTAFIGTMQDWVKHVFSKYSKAIMVSFAFLLVTITVVRSYWSHMSPYYENHYSEKFYDPDLIDVCERIDAIIPQDAVFVQPFLSSPFRYYAHRSSFVDFKSFIPSSTVVGEWARRIQLVYGVKPGLDSDSGEGFELNSPATSFYERKAGGDVSDWKSEGVTHILVPKTVSVGYAPVIANDSYAVYEIH